MFVNNMEPIMLIVKTSSFIDFFHFFRSNCQSLVYVATNILFTKKFIEARFPHFRLHLTG